MLTLTASSSSNFICRAILDALTSTNLSLSCLKSSDRATQLPQVTVSICNRNIKFSKGYKTKFICPYHLNAPLPRIASPVFAQAPAFLPPAPLWLLTANSEQIY